MAPRFLALVLLVGCALGEDTADRAMAADQLDRLEGELLRYAGRQGDLPDSLSEAVSELPLDPWGAAVQYRRLGADRFELIARGADGEIGGEGIDADVTLFGRLP